MHKTHHLILIAALASAAATAVLAGQATAASQSTLSGTFHEDSRTLTFVKESGGNLYFNLQDTHTYTGSLTGTDVFTGTGIIKRDGSVSWHGRSTFTGTLAGCGTGTIVFAADGGGDSLTGPAHCHQEMIDGTKGWEVNLFLEGTTTDLTYGGSYSC